MIITNCKKEWQTIGFLRRVNTSKKIFLTDQEKIYPDKFADKGVLDE